MTALQLLALLLGVWSIALAAAGEHGTWQLFVALSAAVYVLDLAAGRRR